MRATLTIVVALRGVANHYVDITATPADQWTTCLGLVTYSSEQVGGCSCGASLELADQLDWNSPSDGEWAYKHPYPELHQTSGSWSYTDVPGIGGGGTYPCGSAPKGGPPWRCSAETFTVIGYEGSASNSSIQACKKPWAFLASDPANGNRKKNARKVWSYPQTSVTNGGMPTPYFALNSPWPMSYGTSAGVSDGKGWACHRGTQPLPCANDLNDNGSSNTIQINGGFWGGRNGSKVHSMPMPGLTNVNIGIGLGELNQ